MDRVRLPLLKRKRAVQRREQLQQMRAVDSGAQLLSLVANMEDTFARLEQQQSKVPPWLHCVCWRLL